MPINKKTNKNSGGEKIVDLPISKFINTNYRNYAIYVTESRGIPSFYDALTPVQRYILMNTPKSFTKTLSVVGDSIKDGYHHGDAGLGKAISKLARPFGSSIQILEGYGFFGTEVSPEPASARYTSVKLSSKAYDILNTYKYLSIKGDDGSYNPFWLDVPIGLTIGIVGIAVGYKSLILPRKLEDIREYLQGKRKSLKPFFQDFSGTIKKYNNLDKSWIISSNIEIKGSKIEVRGLPPVMKYSSALKKLDWLFSRFEGKIRIANNSNTKVSIDIFYSGKNNEEWIEIQEYIKKAFSIIATESLVFIKEDRVLVYDSIEDYLDDYRWQLLRLDLKNKEYLYNKNLNELQFNKAKKAFIEFMLLKKRTVSEVDDLLKAYNLDLRSKLESLTSKKFTKDELEICKGLIKDLEISLQIRKEELKKAKKVYEETQDPTYKRGLSSKKETHLLEALEVSEENGICIWDGDDPYEKTPQMVELDE